jgi:putative transposase
MPYVRIWIHFVWATKNRVECLNESIRTSLYEHIKSNASEKGIYIDHINGFTDHVHNLISLGTDQTIAKIMQSIKGESSLWLNKQGFLKDKFQWQEEYFAVSVSESMVGQVRQYIRNQPEHHKHKSFQEEYEELISKYGFRKFKDL